MRGLRHRGQLGSDDAEHPRRLNSSGEIAMRLPALRSCLAVLALVVATPIAARPEMKSARVSHADLNLASATDRAVLDARVERAIEEVCGRNWASGIKRRKAVVACGASARAEVKTQVERLTARKRGIVLVASAD